MPYVVGGGPIARQQSRFAANGGRKVTFGLAIADAGQSSTAGKAVMGALSGFLAACEKSAEAARQVLGPRRLPAHER
jgi:hypothetical protein